MKRESGFAGCFLLSFFCLRRIYLDRFVTYEVEKFSLPS